MRPVSLRLLAIAGAIFAIIGTGPGGTVMAAPSFSCAGASTPLDRQICADPGLAAMDVALAAAFHAAQDDAPNAAVKAQLLDEQRRWLSARTVTCPDAGVDCVSQLYQQRVAVLRRSRNEAAWPRLPFKPTLLEGKATPLCNSLFADITATFLGDSLMPNPLGTREIGFSTVPGLPDGMDLRRSEFSPYGGRAMGVLLELDDGGVHLGVAHYRRFTTSIELDRLIASIRGGLSPPSEDVPVFDIDALQDSPTNGMGRPLPNFATDAIVYQPAMPRFFRANGKVLVYAPLALPEDSGLTGVYQMLSPGKGRRLCLFQATPRTDLKLYETVTGQARLADLEAAAVPLLPHGMVCWAVGDDVRTRDNRALWRPWSLDAWPHVPGDTAPQIFARYMRNRGLTGLERYRQYKAYAAAHDTTVASYAGYYASVFAREPTEARSLATLWTDQGLNDDAELDPDDAETEAMLASDFDATHQAAAAVLTGDLTALQAALGGVIRPGGAAARGPYDEPLPTDALEHPDLLRKLLDAGFDPDEFGASGRTPLMTAARLNLVESASVLLDHHAQIDLGAGSAVAEPYVEGDALCLRAGQPPEGDTPGRTALSYAAEVASPAMLRLLLAHGANAAKADEAGVTPRAMAADRSGPDADEVRQLLGAGP